MSVDLIKQPISKHIAGLTAEEIQHYHEDMARHSLDLVQQIKRDCAAAKENGGGKGEVNPD